MFVYNIQFTYGKGRKMIKILEDANKIVIKIGSSFIVDPKTGEPHKEWIDSFVDDVAELIKKGKKIALVSSGAIPLGCGMMEINLAKAKLQDKQNAAVCGQHELMTLYKNSFARHEINIAQALWTIEDVENRKRFLSIRTVTDDLLAKNIIPIFNENDLIANTEIRFGDNDRLAARIAQIVNADLLVMLSLVDGLFSEDPRVNKDSSFISEIYSITPDIEKMASDSENKTGGMSAKVTAAKIALNSNCNIVIANGTYNNPIHRLTTGSRFTSFRIDENSAQKYKIG